MSKLTLAEILAGNWQPSHPGLLITASETALPIVALLRAKLRSVLGNAIYQLFPADRWFNCLAIQEKLACASLFAETNFLEINFKTKPTQEQMQQIMQLLGKIDGNNFLCLICDKLERKNVALYHQWQEQADSLHLSGDDAELRVIIKYLLKSHNMTIEYAGLDLLLSLNLNNPAQLIQETEKLAWLFHTPFEEQPRPAAVSRSSGTLEITANDIRAHLVDNAQYTIYALEHAYLSGDIIKSSTIFSNLCQVNEDVILILWIVAEDVRKLLKIRAYLKNNPVASFNQAISGLRVWGDGVAALAKAHRRISYASFLAFLAELALIDMMVKGVKGGNPLLRLEQLIINFCKGS